MIAQMMQGYLVLYLTIVGGVIVAVLAFITLIILGSCINVIAERLGLE